MRTGHMAQGTTSPSTAPAASRLVPSCNADNTGAVCKSQDTFNLSKSGLFSTHIDFGTISS